MEAMEGPCWGLCWFLGLTGTFPGPDNAGVTDKSLPSQLPHADSPDYFARVSEVSLCLSERQHISQSLCP